MREESKLLNCETYENCLLQQKNINIINSEKEYLNIATFGCWGVYCEEGEKHIRKKNKNLEKETRGQKTVRDLLKQWCDKHDISDIFLTGDNIYPKSLSPNQINDSDFSDYDIKTQLDEGFEKCFKEIKTNRYFLALGNHDIKNCEILSYQKNYDKWKLPSLYYSVSYTLKNFLVKIIILDTNMFEENPKKCNDEPFTNEQILDQSNWAIEESKKNSDWVIVIGHIPFYANGHKTKKPYVKNEKLLSLIKSMRCDLYICADEHNQQFIHDKDNTDIPPIIVCGSGGTHLDDILIYNTPVSGTIFQNSNFGFNGLFLTNTHIQINLISNKTVFSYRLAK